MRILAAIAALCAFVSAYLILVIDRHHERIGDRRRASRRTVMAFRIIGIAGLVLLAWSLPAHARPSPYPATQFSGDRYEARQAQGAGAADVVNAVRSKRRARYLYPTRKRPPVRRQQWRHDIAHGASQRTSGRPSAWCGWWLGHHLGMPLRHLWLARNWASVGTPAHGPAPGVIVVWAHHVGIIVGRHASGWIVKSGNDGNRVRERPRSVSGAIAFRRV
jgi:hypothetical protein